MEIEEKSNRRNMWMVAAFGAILVVAMVVNYVLGYAADEAADGLPEWQSFAGWAFLLFGAVGFVAALIAAFLKARSRWIPWVLGAMAVVAVLAWSTVVVVASG